MYIDVINGIDMTREILNSFILLILFFFVVIEFFHLNIILREQREIQSIIHRGKTTLLSPQSRYSMLRSHFISLRL